MPGGITFVTSILHIYETEYEEYKTIPWRIERFQELVALGLKLCVYVSPEMEPLLRPIEAANPSTVKIMRVLRCEDTMIAKMLDINAPAYRMPTTRNEGKDQAKYNIVINSKTEFMTDTVDRNPWDTTHFAWIDFNITYVFNDKPRTMAFLEWMAAQTWIEPNCFVIAGCAPWPPYTDDYPVHITEGIYWRFCGGFFLGDADSIRRFHQFYLDYFPRFLQTYRVLVWEVNFWAWLETNTDWNPEWYPADHDDTILCDIPMRVFTRALCGDGGTLKEKITYNYPMCTEPTYLPSSAAYLETPDGKHYLNTRYVNYLYHDEGYYQFYTNEAIIRNRNFLSELDPTNRWYPKYYSEIQETIPYPEYPHGSRGIEDIRLYYFRGKVRYIATTMGYNPEGGTRMMVGDYCVDRQRYENSQMVDSPEGNYLEKNWAPVIVHDPASEFHDRELFVYKWSPFTVGELREGRLELVAAMDIWQTPFFHKMKGSTQFVDTGEYLVGVVHFTEDAKPRKYFHMLVALDRRTLRPLRYSDPFCFERPLIEFCIGFRVCEGGGEYMFWISRMDRDPLLICVDAHTIPICRDFLVSEGL